MQAHNSSSSDLNFGTEVRFPMTKHKRKLKILSIDQERTFAKANKVRRHRAEKAELKTEEPAVRLQRPMVLALPFFAPTLFRSLHLQRRPKQAGLHLVVEGGEEARREGTQQEAHCEGGEKERSVFSAYTSQKERQDCSNNQKMSNNK